MARDIVVTRAPSQSNPGSVVKSEIRQNKMMINFGMLTFLSLSRAAFVAIPITDKSHRKMSRVIP
jgi:hypothetical protein